MGYLANKKHRELQKIADRKTDTIRKQEYDLARQSMLGEFAAEPVCTTGGCRNNLLKRKAARRQERLNLVNRAMVTCPAAHGDIAEQLRKDMDEVENMRCAKHVYLANDPNAPAELRESPPLGFKKASKEDLKKLGLTEEDLNPEGSNFKAAVYIKDPAVWGEGAKPASVLAFRGSTPALEDWENNFAQNANEDSTYYKRAVTIGNKLAENDADTHIVGHSLGGGLASAAQGGSGLTASTYNSAGLHPKTVARYSQDKNYQVAQPNKITAIRVEGEVLTETQESGFTSYFAEKAVGNKTNIAPSRDEAAFKALKKAGKVDKDEDYTGYLHGMDQVIDSMEKRKTAAEATLRSCLETPKK